jgi:glutamate dehydrogenase (NADP+)
VAGLGDGAFPRATQNGSRVEVDERLKQIMLDIHGTCVRYGERDNGFVNYVHGANRGGFVKVAEAMLAYGVM